MQPPFKNIFFDIVNYCNAKCPYCLTGPNNPRKVLRHSIRVEDFEKGLEKLIDAKLIDEKTDIGLFNWGEPALHPDLPGIVSVINKLNLKYSLSTNGSVEISFSKEMVLNLRRIIFSMSGFSQKSYSKIHGFSFEKIRRNISGMSNSLEALNYKGVKIIYFHVYQFNTGELDTCNEYAKALSIIFKPFYAILNQWDDLTALTEGNLPYDRLKRVSEELFSFDINEKLAAAPADYSCPQFNNLVIDENLNILPCCQLPKNRKEFISGNLLTDDIEKILENRLNHIICPKCKKSGLAYYINNSLTKPEFFKG